MGPRHEDYQNFIDLFYMDKKSCLLRCLESLIEFLNIFSIFKYHHRIKTLTLILIKQLFMFYLFMIID